MNPTRGIAEPRTEAQFERTLTVTGPVALAVSIRSGRVRIRRGEEGCVAVRAVLRAQPSVFAWIHPQGEVHHVAEDPPVRQEGNTIEIGDMADRWLLRRIHVVIDVAVPAQTRVRALSDSGDIRIEGIAGPVDCESDSGEIDISGIASQVSATTDSGAIQIREVGGPVDAETDSGDIQVLAIAGGIDAHSDSSNIHLSQTVAAPIYVQSDSGRVSLKLAPAGGYTFRLRTDDGRVDCPEMVRTSSSHKETEGVVRGGGSIVAIETDSGDIDIV